MKVRWALSIFLTLQLGNVLGSFGQSIPTGSLRSPSGLTVSDLFAGTSLSSNWTPVVGSLTVSRGLAGSADNATTWATAYWNHDSFPANQYSQAALQGGSAGHYAWAAVAVRVQPTTGTDRGHDYFCGSSSGSGGVWQGTVYLIKGAGSTFTTISSASATLHDGDILRASAVGSTISCAVNGANVIIITDSTYSSGQPGFVAGSATPFGQAITGWSAGAL